GDCQRTFEDVGAIVGKGATAKRERSATRFGEEGIVSTRLADIAGELQARPIVDHNNQVMIRRGIDIDSGGDSIRTCRGKNHAARVTDGWCDSSKLENAGTSIG